MACMDYFRMTTLHSKDVAQTPNSAADRPTPQATGNGSKLCDRPNSAADRPTQSASTASLLTLRRLATEPESFPASLLAAPLPFPLPRPPVFFALPLGATFSLSSLAALGATFSLSSLAASSSSGCSPSASSMLRTLDTQSDKVAQLYTDTRRSQKAYTCITTSVGLQSVAPARGPHLGDKIVFNNRVVDALQALPELFALERVPGMTKLHACDSIIPTK